jgi:hypothetical protein
LVALVGPNAGVGAEPAGVENLSLGCSMIVGPSAGFGFCRCARHKSRETIVINIPEIAGGGQITEDGVRRKEPRNFLKSSEEGVALEPGRNLLGIAPPNTSSPPISARNPPLPSFGHNLIGRPITAVICLTGNHIGLQLVPIPSACRAAGAAQRPFFGESGGEEPQTRPVGIRTKTNQIASEAPWALDAVSNTRSHGRMSANDGFHRQNWMLTDDAD